MDEQKRIDILEGFVKYQMIRIECLKEEIALLIDMNKIYEESLDAFGLKLTPGGKQEKDNQKPDGEAEN